MATKKYKTGNATQLPITDLKDLPSGYKALQEYGEGRKQGCSGSPEYEILHRAWANKNIDGYKLMKTVNDKSGAVFVNDAQAQQILRTETLARDAQSAQRTTEKADPLVLEQLGSIASGLQRLCTAVERVVHQLERIADDADEMATKPDNAHDRVVATVESNGFHN